MHKPVLITLGLVCVGLAVLGVFLPVLPTTPLLLLALACFAKSSERLHSWLLSNKTFGPVIRNWEESRSMPRRAKLFALALIAVAGGSSAYFIENTALRLGVIAFLLVPVIIILSIRTTKSP